MCEVEIKALGTITYQPSESFTVGFFYSAESTLTVGDYGINCLLTVSSNTNDGIGAAFCDFVTLHSTNSQITWRLDPKDYRTEIVSKGNNGGNWVIKVTTEITENDFFTKQVTNAQSNFFHSIST